MPIVTVILPAEIINVIWVMITSSTLGKNKAFDSLQFEFNFVLILNLNGEYLNFEEFCEVAEPCAVFADDKS